MAPFWLSDVSLLLVSKGDMCKSAAFWDVMLLFACKGTGILKDHNVFFKVRRSTKTDSECEALWFFEPSGATCFTQHHILEDLVLCQNCCENLKYCSGFCVL